LAWYVPSTGQYSVWSTDSNGNYVSNIIGTASGTDFALESIETSFHQDLNGDGVIGVPTTVIEANGSTHLTEVGNNYYLYDSSGSGPSLKYNGAAVVDGQNGFGTAVVPIAAEAIAGGYELAWKVPSTGQYSVWSTDSNGNYISNIIGTASGTDVAFESIETSFHQDLNGDGVIGVPTSVIEAAGSTHLTKVGNNYYLDDSSGSGPSLKYNGAAVVDGRFSADVVPIGAEATANGYEIAWKVLSTGQYSVWSTDSNGNYVSNIISTASATDVALESIETSFHQDLNGDGVIGVPTRVIEANGSTHLTEVGNNYYLYDSSGSGPSLKYNGAAVVDGQFSANVVPIGAEATANGYEIAWKVLSAGQYSVWSTDSNGNYNSNIIGSASGTDVALESIETSFHQDLNGDGVIGVTAGSAPTVGADSPALWKTSTNGDSFHFLSQGDTPAHDEPFLEPASSNHPFNGWPGPPAHLQAAHEGAGMPDALVHTGPVWWNLAHTDHLI
jgi:serralysin